MTKQNSGLGLFTDLPADPTRPISKADFAREVCLSRGRITQLAGQGLPVRADGRIDRDAALAWMAKNLDPSRRRKPAPSVDMATAPVVPSPQPGGGSLVEVKRTHEIIKAKRSHLALEKEAGRLVDRATVEGAILIRARRERDAHLAWVLRVTPLISGELSVDPGELFAVLEREMRAHLADLAATPLEDLPDG